MEGKTYTLFFSIYGKLVFYIDIIDQFFHSSLEPLATYAEIMKNCSLEGAWRTFSLYGSTSILKELFKHKKECPLDDIELLQNVVKSDNPNACKVVLESLNNNVSPDVM